MLGDAGTGRTTTLGKLADELTSVALPPAVLAIAPESMEAAVRRRRIRLGLPSVADALRAEGKADGAFALPPSALTAEQWCEAFGIGDPLTGPMGLLVREVCRKLREGSIVVADGEGGRRSAGIRREWILGDMVACVRRDLDLQDPERGFQANTMDAVVERLEAAALWQIFGAPGHDLSDLLRPGWTTVLDMHMRRSGVGLGPVSLVVAHLARDLLRRRVAGPAGGLPATWLIVDDADALKLSSASSPAGAALAAYVKQGRAAGCGLVIAASRASELSAEILSQADVVVGHKTWLTPSIDEMLSWFPADPPLPGLEETRKHIENLDDGQVVVADARKRPRAFTVRIAA